MYILHVLNADTWREYARFVDKRNYAQLIATAVEDRLKNGKTEEMKNSATVMHAFVLEGKYFAQKDGKVIKRALRHFDEVGLSNDIFEALESLLDEGCTAFALAKEGHSPASLTQGEITVCI
ncbi:MAG: hypothetical protein E7368_00335 [Clostridiales bacterium]|nr:hypothetical protein [Clostridiales bacterium]